MLRNRIVVSTLTLICLATFLGCSSEVTMSENSSVPSLNTLVQERIDFQYAIYYLPSPTKDPIGVLDTLLKEEFTNLHKVNEVPENPTEMVVVPAIITDVKETYIPPDLDSLRYFGRGLTRKQAEFLQDSEQALVLDFSHPKEEVWNGLHAANLLVSRIARQTNGLIWDEETREVFTPDEWDRVRIESWVEEIPDVSKHTTIHAYQTDEYVRAITLGMKKFGLPDVVIDEFSWSLNRNMGHLINLFSQAMLEGGMIEKDGIFDLDIREIKNTEVREPMLASLKPNATSIAMLSLQEGVWEEGDPYNRLLEITFDRYDGVDVHAKQETMLSSLFGWEDKIVPVQHDDELLIASQKAREKLPFLRMAFNAGLTPGEFIQVKAPFAAPDGGNEWMWVEVTSWEGTKIKGILKNEPFNIPDLHGGQTVEISEDTVFDYIRRFPDGTEEGNETSKIIERQNRAGE